MKSPEIPSNFLTWFKNGCTSGCPNTDAAKRIFLEHSPEKQAELVQEFNNVQEMTKRSSRLSNYGGCTLD